MQSYVRRGRYDSSHWVMLDVLLNTVMTGVTSAEEIKLWCGWQLLNEVSDCLNSGNPFSAVC